MKYQVTATSCGANALCNAIRFLGGEADEVKVMALAGTSWDGTSEKGVRRAAKALGYRVDVITRPGLFWQPGVVCVDGGEHWIAAARLVGGLVVIVDGASVDLTKVITVEQFEARAVDEKGKFFAMILTKKGNAR